MESSRLSLFVGTPLGPGEHPVGALLKHSAKIFASNFNSVQGRTQGRWNVPQPSLGSSSSQLVQRVLVPRQVLPSTPDGLWTLAPAAPSSERPALFVVPHFRGCCGFRTVFINRSQTTTHKISPTTLLTILRTFGPIRFFQLTQCLGVCATTWTGSKRTISKLGFLRQRRSPILPGDARSMRWRKPDTTSLANDGGALPQCWHSRGENFCQIKFVQLRPTSILVPLHCVVDELGAEPPLDVAADTTLCPYERQRSHKPLRPKATRTSKRQPSLRSASRALEEMWFAGCVAGNPCSPNQRERCSRSTMPQLLNTVRRDPQPVRNACMACN